jgi:hypothetical protein
MVVCWGHKGHPVELQESPKERMIGNCLVRLLIKTQVQQMGPGNLNQGGENDQVIYCHARFIAGGPGA